MQVCIDATRCSGCGSCLSLCPAGAIRPGAAPGDSCHIVQEDCLRCGLCLRLRACPNQALTGAPGDEPSRIQSFFSDPNTTHRLTGVPGRGTEECKTNDVTGRVSPGMVGLCIEFGRPGLGCSFADIELLTTRLISKGLRMEKNNPLCALMDPATGRFPKALAQRRILSSILEIILPDHELDNVLETLQTIARQIETVFSVGLVCCFEPDGTLPVLKRLASMGISPRPNGKINLGLGRIKEKG